jgi:N-acetylmuramoyl-L-alanine amidase
MRIFIDAGHNGRGIDPGAVGPSGLLEANVALAVARLVNTKLQGIGIETKMYRDGNIPFYGGSSNTDLRHRCNVANSWGADYFVSIHCNSASPAAHGTETYCYKFGGNGEKLARCIQDRLIHAVGLTNRGVKEGNFAVIRDTSMPAVLVELAFISNSAEEKLLADERWQDIFAKAIAEGILDFLGIDCNNYKKVGGMVEEHWAQKNLNSLVTKGIIQNPELWQNFDANLSTKTIGELLALIDKATNR